MSAKSIKKDSLAFLNELVACHRNSHKNEIKKQTFEVLHVHLRFVIRRSAVRYNIFHMVVKVRILGLLTELMFFV